MAGFHCSRAVRLALLSRRHNNRMQLTGRGPPLVWGSSTTAGFPHTPVIRAASLQLMRGVIPHRLSMTEEVTRPLTPAEVTTLRAQLLYYTTRIGGLGCALTVAILAFLTALLLVSASITLTAHGGSIALAVALAAGLLALWRAPYPPDSARMRATLPADLSDGTARVTTYYATDAIRVTEGEDEGGTLLLAVGEGRVLYLSDYDLADHLNSGTLPTRRIVIAKAPNSGLILNVGYEGQPFVVTTIRAPFTQQELAGYPLDTHGMVVNADFEGLRSPPPASPGAA